MKYYFTLGQDHRHTIGGVLIDKDTVAVVEAPTHRKARELFFAWTKGKFCTSYTQPEWEALNVLHYFPKGEVHLQEPQQ